MSDRVAVADRRRFLKTALQAGAALAAPYVVPGAALGKDGAVPPSRQIILGGIGIGSRGSSDLGCFMQEADVRVVANCNVRADRRRSVKEAIDTRYGNHDCTAYHDFRDLLARPDIDAVLITTGSNWHALLSIFAAKAGKDVYCEKPCTKTIVESLALADVFRRTASVPGRHATAELAPLPVRRRIGPARQARQAPDGPRPSGRAGDRHERLGRAAARTTQGRGGLGDVPRLRRLAAVQLGTAQFRL